MTFQVTVTDLSTVAAGSVAGVTFAESLAAPAAGQANDIAIGMRNDLTITGNASNWTGSTDFLSGNFTNTFNNTGTMPTAGGFQSGVYVNGAGTYTGLRGYVLHSEFNAAASVGLFKGIEFLITTNVAAITNLRWIDIPDTRSTPGGGSIGQEWILYSPNPNNKLEIAGLSRAGQIDITSTSTSGVFNGFYLTGANQLALVTSSGVRFNFNSGGMSANSGHGPRVVSNLGASATAPTLIPDQTTPAAGIGADSPGDVSLIANNGGTGVEIFRATANGTVEKAGKVLPVRTFTGSGSVSLLVADQIVVINKATAAATTANLPATPTTGQVYVIKDGKGDAGANPITVTPASGTIDGAATYVINTNYGAARVIYTGAEWSVT